MFPPLDDESKKHESGKFLPLFFYTILLPPVDNLDEDRANPSRSAILQRTPLVVSYYWFLLRCKSFLLRGWDLHQIEIAVWLVLSWMLWCGSFPMIASGASGVVGFQAMRMMMMTWWRSFLFLSPTRSASPQPDVVLPASTAQLCVYLFKMH